MLAKVPADSPYLMAVLDPMPELVRRQTYKALDKKLAELMAAAELEASVDRSHLNAKQKLVLALADELKGKDMANWGRELGFDPSGRFVLYGLSIWPVMRIAVGNEERLRGVIRRLLAAAEVPHQERTYEGRVYWQLGDAKFAVIGAVLDHEIVVAALPAPALAQFLPIVLGVQRPPRSLHDDNRLGNLIKRYKFLPTMIGYLDAQIAADIFTQRASSTNTELDRPLRAAMGPVETACGEDLDRLVAIVPRVVFGYRRLDARGMHATLIAEMPSEITEALQRLRTSVPEVTAGLGGRALIKFGVAAQLDELLPLLHRITDHIEAKPFRCAWFAELNRGAAELAAVLDKPVPPMLFGVRGFSFTLDDMTKNPTTMRGHGIIVADHASDLLNLVLKFLPGASGLTVLPDSRPVQIPLTGLGAPASITGYVATRVDRTAIAVGPSSASDVVSALAAPLPRGSPLMTVGFDMDRMEALELVKPEDAGRVGDVVMQLDATPDGLAIEMYGTFPAL